MQSASTAHKDLNALMGKLERLKAQADLLEEEIERDVKQLKDKWGIEDIDQALKSIDSIMESAQQHAHNRDRAIEQAEKILSGMEGRQ